MRRKERRARSRPVALAPEPRPVWEERGALMSRLRSALARSGRFSSGYFGVYLGISGHIWVYLGISAHLSLSPFISAHFCSFLLLSRSSPPRVPEQQRGRGGDSGAQMCTLGLTDRRTGVFGDGCECLGVFWSVWGCLFVCLRVFASLGWT